MNKSALLDKNNVLEIDDSILEIKFGYVYFFLATALDSESFN